MKAIPGVLTAKAHQRFLKGAWRMSILAALGILLFVSPKVLTGQEKSMKLMTFNIRYDNPADGVNSWEERKEFVIQFLGEYEPDIMGLQEALGHQVAYLEKNLVVYGFLGVARDDGKATGEFAPVFYRKDRFRVVDWGTFWLSETPEDTGSVGWDAALPRICTWAKLHDLMIGSDFFFLNTHFDHVGASARIESSRLISGFIQNSTDGLPVILTGDFNCTPDEEPYRVLTQGDPGLWDACGDERFVIPCREGTFNGFVQNQHTGRIDMILLKGDLEVTDYQVVRSMKGEMFVSDHWPVIVTARWR